MEKYRMVPGNTDSLPGISELVKFKFWRYQIAYLAH